MAKKHRKGWEPTVATGADLCRGITDVGEDLLMFVTGAGVSTASGLPTFRGTDPDAVWAKDVTELGTLRYFTQEPAKSWAWYLARFHKLEGARPNAAHAAIAELGRWHAARGGTFSLVTQNIDGLHQLAGSAEVIDVHGRADRVRCSRVRCVHGAPKGSLPRADFDFGPLLNDPVDANVPACPECGCELRPHVLWFDEYYDDHRDFQIGTVYRNSKRAKCVVFVGTSFAVGVTAGVLEHSLARGATVFSVDPSGRSPHRSVRVVAENAEEVLPGVVESLG